MWMLRRSEGEAVGCGQGGTEAVEFTILFLLRFNCSAQHDWGGVAGRGTGRLWTVLYGRRRHGSIL